MAGEKFDGVDEKLEDRVERWRKRALLAEDRLRALRNVLIDLLNDNGEEE